MYIYIHGLIYTHAMNVCLHMWAHAGMHTHADTCVVHIHMNELRNS